VLNAGKWLTSTSGVPAVTLPISVALQHTVLSMLTTNAYVHVFALDFSKAFETVRHAVLMDKMAKLRMPDEVCNWIRDFFDNHSHCTKFSGEISTLADIRASVIQGSGLGPASYLVMAADMRPISDKNRMIKFADDTYLIVPAECAATSEDELANIQYWAQGCNLGLNRAKTKEIIFGAKGRRGNSTPLPAACPGVDRVEQLTALGVVINNRMTAADHVGKLLETCARRLYVLRVLRHHGLHAQHIHERRFQDDSACQDVILWLFMVWLVFCGGPRKIGRVHTPL